VGSSAQHLPTKYTVRLCPQTCVSVMYQEWDRPTALSALYSPHLIPLRYGVPYPILQGRKWSLRDEREKAALPSTTYLLGTLELCLYHVI
jgi:hypothetical protein